MSAAEGLVCIPAMIEKETERIGDMISRDKLMIDNLIKKENIEKAKESMTLIFPTSSKLESRVSGFAMFQHFKKHELEDNENLQ